MISTSTYFFILITAHLMKRQFLPSAGAMVALEMLSSELQDLYEGGFLKLEVLQGHVISDNVVRPI